MTFTHRLTYDAPPAEVAAMLADPDFRDRVCRALHVLRHDVRVDGSGAGMRVSIDQTQPAQGIPSFAKKFVGDQIRIVQQESWSSLSAADFSVEIPGKPGHIRGTIALDGDDTHTVESVTGAVKVAIPLVGGRLEGLIGDLLVSALRTEEKVGRRWLAGER
jgi:hypothetical protein